MDYFPARFFFLSLFPYSFHSFCFFSPLYSFPSIFFLIYLSLFIFLLRFFSPLSRSFSFFSLLSSFTSFPPSSSFFPFLFHHAGPLCFPSSHFSPRKLCYSASLQLVFFGRKWPTESQWSPLSQLLLKPPRECALNPGSTQACVPATEDSWCSGAVPVRPGCVATALSWITRRTPVLSSL